MNKRNKKLAFNIIVIIAFKTTKATINQRLISASQRRTKINSLIW